MEKEAKTEIVEKEEIVEEVVVEEAVVEEEPAHRHSIILPLY